MSVLGKRLYQSLTVNRFRRFNSLKLVEWLRTMQNFSGNILSEYDAEQVKLMTQECIAVDQNDKVVGPISKYKCHLQSEGPILHRAFSVFLFNSKGELLLQKRADSKITFPGYYTNTCCSHPLHNSTELNEVDNAGVKLAAQRRMNQELGVEKTQFPLEDINFLTRVHYKASSCDTWGEHEIDYVLFAQRDVDLNLNPNEVSEVKYVSLENFENFRSDCEKNNIPLTPWFRLIADTELMQWWRNLGGLKSFTGQSDIVRL